MVSEFACAEEQSGKCDAPVKDGVELFANEECLLGLVRDRCKGRDECFVRCLTGGEHRRVNENGDTVNIGGGCFHICDYAGKSGWEFPLDSEQCGYERP